MKFLKGLFLVIIVIIMISLIVLIQIEFAAQQTLFSSRYFEKIYDKSNMGDSVAELVGVVTGQITSVAAISPDETESLYDEEALQQSASDLIKGLYAYMTGHKSKLPSFEIRPFVDLTINSILTEITSDEEMLLVLSVIFENFDSMDTANQEIFKASLVNEYLIPYGFSPDKAEEFADNLFAAGTSISDTVTGNERVALAIKSTVLELINYDGMANDLDLDELMEEIYKDRDNPAIAAREAVLALKNTLFTALLVLMFIYLVIVALITFKASEFFGWLSAPLIAGGLFGLGVGFLGLFMPYAASMANEASIDVSSNGTQRIMLFLDNYSRGITSLMLIQGAVILLLGIVFIVIAAVVSSRERKSRRTQAAKSPLIAIRVILVVVLLLGAFFTTGLFYNTVFETLENSSKKIENAGEAMEDGALARALEKTINIDISFYGQ